MDVSEPDMTEDGQTNAETGIVPHEENIVLLDMSDVYCEVHVDNSLTDSNGDLTADVVNIAGSNNMQVNADHIESGMSSGNFHAESCDNFGGCGFDKEKHCGKHGCGFRDSAMNKYFKDESTQTDRMTFISVEYFRNDSKGLQFYSGIENYEKFLFIFNTLTPECLKLNYFNNKTETLYVKDQLFLTLMKLRTNKEDVELAWLFGISESSVKNIFITWMVFMYKMWSQLDTWPSRDLINFYMPEDFKIMFPSVRVIIQCFEFPISKPADNAMQHATLSLTSDRHTLKVLIGVTASGLVAFCSDAYGGAISDYEMVELSGILDKLEPNDSIIVNKKLNIKDLCAAKQVNVISLDFKKKSARAREGPSLLGSLAKTKYHFQGFDDLLSQNKILTENLSQDLRSFASEIFFVCMMLNNFLERDGRSRLYIPH